MNYEREEYMRRQDAEHDMIRMRRPVERKRIQPDPYGCPYLGTHKPCPLCDCSRRKLGRMVDSELVARMIEQQEIAPIIKQRLIDGLIDLRRDSDGSPKGGDGTAPFTTARAEGIAQASSEPSQ